MDLPFSGREYTGRKRATLRAMAARELDGLLMFRQESMYYLTGLHTFGYCFFQCVYLGADGRMTLLSRLPDVIVARHTTLLDDCRVWQNLPGANPAGDLREILEERGCRGKRLGIELEAYGLTASNHQRVEAALNGFCHLVDASDLVTRLRVIKSAKEIEYCRKAGGLADAGLEEANRLVVPGAWEGDILAAMQGAVFKGDGDYSGNEFIINSGPRALFGRYTTGRRHLEKRDQLTIEWAGVYRFYHAAMMRTVLTGKPSETQIALHRTAVEAHRASAEMLRPGRTFGEVFDAYAGTISRAGHKHLGATGYSLGSTFPPTWMDWPMFWHGNEEPIRPGMVLFVHTLVMSEDERLAQAPGQTYIVTEDGPEPLSHMPLDLVANA
jgi:Xaa-Pro dipeptidase